jgi:hypothetical protein
MLADPFGDIGLRRHHALLDRTIPGELQIFLLAIIGIGDRTDGQDDFNQSVLHSKAWLSHITSNSSPRFKFRQQRRRRPHAKSLYRRRQSAHKQETSIEAPQELAALTLDVSVQCFENTQNSAGFDGRFGLCSLWLRMPDPMTSRQKHLVEER